MASGEQSQKLISPRAITGYTKPMTQKSYKQMQAELDDVLARIQNEELDVEEAIKLYEQGEQLIVELEKYLKTAENKISKLKLPKT